MAVTAARTQPRPWTEMTTPAVEERTARRMRMEGMMMMMMETAETTTTAETTRRTATTAMMMSYYNVGLYDVDGMGGYPPQNGGLFEISGIPSDMGRFRVPTLRNVEASNPYMHDGSIYSLAAAVDVFAEGGRDLQSGPHAGNGKKNQYKNSLLFNSAVESSRA